MTQESINPELELQQVLTQMEFIRIEKDSIKKEITQLQESLMQKDIEIRNLRQQIPTIENKIKQEKKKALLARTEIKDIHEARQILEQYKNEIKRATYVYHAVNNARAIIKEYEG